MSDMIHIPEGSYAVIFIADLADDTGYGEMANRMVELAQTMPGYIAVESQRGAAGRGITVSYWETEADILNWKRNTEHLEAQRTGRKRFYSQFTLQVAKVERSYHMKK
ncbi:MAG: antibiotic biosynthesis monooxygenase family protein [Alphaproteobacteria bacterium]